MAFMDRFKRKPSYADRLRTTNIAPGMVRPERTPYQMQLDELAERLNPSDKVMRTSRAPDIYEPIKVLGDPVPQQMAPGRLPDPARPARSRSATQRVRRRGF
jgi:hypothetical protein